MTTTPNSRLRSGEPARPAIAGRDGIRRLLEWLLGRSGWRAPAAAATPLLLFQSAGNAAQELIDYLGEALERAKPAPATYARPLVHRQGSDDRPGDRPVRWLLRKLVNQLGVERRHPQFGRYRFPRYRLMVILTGLGNRIEDLDDRAAMARLIRTADPTQQSAKALADELRPAFDLAAKLTLGFEQLPRIPFLGRLLFGWRVRTRWAWWGGAYHWFRTRTYLRALVSTDFYNQAYDIAHFAALNEYQDDVDELLVYAFLEDLQANYRRGPWPRQGWARTTHCVALLDEVTAQNGGISLCWYVNKIRRDTGRGDDGLLVVGALPDPGRATPQDNPGTEDIPGTQDTERRRWATRGAELVSDSYVVADDTSPQAHYEQWKHALPDPGARRYRDPYPWPLVMRVTRIKEEPSRQRYVDLPIRYRRRPGWTRPLVVGVALVVVCALVFGGIPWWRRATHCNVGLVWNTDPVVRIGDECIGLAAPSHHFEKTHLPKSNTPGGKQIDLADLQQRITKQNELVEVSGRPYVTIAYLGPISSRSTAAIHELSGVYLAQITRNQAGQPTQGEGADPTSLIGPDPLLRLRLANAGDRMAHQLTAAQQIADAARDDPTLVGVVGLGRNKEDSAQTLGTLWAAGLPVVATSNSSDGLHGSSPYYFHVAPTNQQEAQLAVDHLATLHIPAGAVFEDVREPYSRELAEDFRKAASKSIKGIQLNSITYGQQGSKPENELPAKATAACDAANGNLELIYYAGRSEDLPRLFSGLTPSRCKSQGRPITVLSGDDLTRYLQPPPTLVDLSYTTLTYPPVWECTTRWVVPEMFAQYERAFEAGHKPGFRDPNLIGGHAALGFDAVSALAQAATAAHGKLRDASRTAPQQARYATITTSAVLHELGRTSFNGATGSVDLRTQWRGGAVAREGAWEKAVVLVHVTADGKREMQRVAGPLAVSSRGDQVELRTKPPCPPSKT